MPFPRRLLFDGEDIVLDLRPHWWFFAGPASLLAVSLVVSLVLIVADLPGWLQDWLPWAVAGVVLASLLWFAARYTRWATINFVLTTDRLIFRSGVVAKRGVEIPLERINTVFLHQTILERMLRSGDLVIESGGEQGRESFADVRRPGSVQNEIYRQIEENQNRMRTGVVPEPDVVDQIERLDDLRKRGVISEFEFQAKKAELLDRL